ncbi:MAG: hypothetical protein JWP09_891 [Candidatus Taylorbacteria bacterium]|nr:hypothetical protein [Candidatus Taylorbacteria bacterium]
MAIIWNKVTWYSKLLAVILAILIFGVGLYFGSEFEKLSLIVPNTVQPVIQNVKTDTSDWKTYQNDKYGFKIKYPATYFIFQSADQVKESVTPVSSDSKQIYITGNKDMFFCCEPSYVLIKIDPETKDLDVRLEEEKAKLELRSVDANGIQALSTNIAGVKAFNLTTQPVYGGELQELIFDKGGNSYTVMTNFNENESYKEIIKSLELTK